MELSVRNGRKIFLYQQGLLKADTFGRGKNAVDRSINRLSYLQIDTISVVNRAHQHILLSRIPNFSQSQLDKLVAEKRIYEYWAHAAAFLPMSNYRYSLPIMAGWRKSRKHNKKLAREILARIRAEGPLQSKDFEAPRGSNNSGWWDWKPAKHELEYMFLAGDLMVSERVNFQKVYDLTERVLPSQVDTSMPTIEELCDHLVLSMAEALGPATELDLGYAKGAIRQLTRQSVGKNIKEAISRLCEDGRLIPVLIEQIPHYIKPEHLELLPLRVVKRRSKITISF